MTVRYFVVDFKDSALICLYINFVQITVLSAKYT